MQLGKEFEDEILNGVKMAIQELKIQNTVVLSGLELKDDTSNKVGEFEFFVISSAYKSIIHIEAIKGDSKLKRKLTSEPLRRGQTFFEENFPFPTSENWKYIHMMCFEESDENDICDQCKCFVIGSDFVFTNRYIKSLREKIAHQFTSFLNSLSHVKGTCFFII